MTFEKIWEQLCRKEPRLKIAGTKIEFTSKGLEQLLKQVYDHGVKNKSDVDDFLGGLFRR